MSLFRRALALVPFLLLLVPYLLRGAPASDEEREAQVARMYQELRPAFADVPEIDAPTLAERLKQGEVVLVDVREDAERQVSTLPGAISKADYEARRAELAGRPVVVYCTIGYRSGLYATELASQGVDVANFAGSVLAWTFIDGPFVDPTGAPTRRVHVYGRSWNLVKSGYEGIW